MLGKTELVGFNAVSTASWERLPKIALIEIEERRGVRRVT